MKKYDLFLLVMTVFLIVLFCRPVLAGPFGLDMGMNIEQLKSITNIEGNNNDEVFKCTKVPNPSSIFDAYYISVDGKVGLYRIMAVVNLNQLSNYGDQIKTNFNYIEELINNKYGKGTRYDFLKANSLWKDPNEWTMSLLKKERVLNDFWLNSDGLNMPDHINSIALAGVAFSRTSGGVSLTYEFTNIDDAIKNKKNKQGSSL